MAKSVRFNVSEPRGYFFPQVEEYAAQAAASLEYLENAVYQRDRKIHEILVELDHQTYDVQRLRTEIELFKVQGNPLVNADGSYVTESQQAAQQAAVDPEDVQRLEADLEHARQYLAATQADLEQAHQRAQEQDQELQGMRQWADSVTADMTAAHEAITARDEALTAAYAEITELRIAVQELQAGAAPVQRTEADQYVVAAHDVAPERAAYAEGGEEPFYEVAEQEPVAETQHLANEPEASVYEETGYEEQYVQPEQAQYAQGGAVPPPPPGYEQPEQAQYAQAGAVPPPPPGYEQPEQAQYAQPGAVPPPPPGYEQQYAEPEQAQYAQPSAVPPPPPGYEQQYAEPQGYGDPVGYSSEPTYGYDSTDGASFLGVQDGHGEQPLPVMPVDSELPEGVYLPTGEPAAATFQYTEAAPGAPLNSGQVPLGFWAPELNPEVLAAANAVDNEAQDPDSVPTPRLRRRS